LQRAGRRRNCRSLLSVENLVGAIRHCIDHPAARNRTFLVSDGQDISTSALIRCLAETRGKRANLIPIPPSLLRGAARLLGLSSKIDQLTGDLLVDDELIRAVTGWVPPLSTEASIGRIGRPE
ncbi:MAG TPA: hypothetical protein VM598_02685, partial [Bdellovibrionota bacterium]|nr:hypothetical protein [Bdellovibrionota bacterium]